MAFRRSPVRSWSAPPVASQRVLRDQIDWGRGVAGSNWRPPSGGLGGQSPPLMEFDAVRSCRRRRRTVRSRSAPPNVASAYSGPGFATGERLGRTRPRSLAWSLARSRSRSARLLPSGRLLALRPGLRGPFRKFSAAWSRTERSRSATSGGSAAANRLPRPKVSTARLIPRFALAPAARGSSLAFARETPRAAKARGENGGPWASC